MRFLAAYALLFLVLLGGIVTDIQLTQPGHSVRPACKMWILQPLVVTCTNGHGYVRQDGRWIDLGTGSPGGLLPSR